MRGRQLEPVQPDHGRQRALVRVGRGLLDQHAVQPRRVQLVGGGQVRGPFLRRHVVQHDLRLRPGLDPPHQQVHGAPYRLRRLEVRMVQHAAHGGGQRAVHLRDQLVLLRVAGRRDEGADQAAHQVVHLGRLRLLRRAAGQPGEVGQAHPRVRPRRRGRRPGDGAAPPPRSRTAPPSRRGRSRPCCAGCGAAPAGSRTAPRSRPAGPDGSRPGFRSAPRPFPRSRRAAAAASAWCGPARRPGCRRPPRSACAGPGPRRAPASRHWPGRRSRPAPPGGTAPPRPRAASGPGGRS